MNSRPTGENRVVLALNYTSIEAGADPHKRRIMFYELIYRTINSTTALLFDLIAFQGHAKKHPAPNRLARGGILKKGMEMNKRRETT